MHVTTVTLPGMLPLPEHVTFHDTSALARERAIDELQTDLDAHIHSTRHRGRGECDGCRRYAMAIRAIASLADVASVSGIVYRVEEVPS